MSCVVDLLKVLFMNAQYLIVYVCRAKTHGDLDSDYGVGCDGIADVKIYGRTAVITDSVRRMLADIARPRSCVDLTNMELVKQNGSSVFCWKLKKPGCRRQTRVLLLILSPNSVSYKTLTRHVG